MAGTRGPVPKRKDEVAGNHRTKDKITKLQGEAAPAPGARPGWRSEVIDFFRAAVLTMSIRGVSAAEWQMLLIASDLLENWYDTDQSAAKMAEFNKMTTNLMLTEGALRRQGIEVTRQVEDDEVAADAMAELRVIAGEG